MSWILLAAGAQFLSAIVALLDKYIVSDDKLLPQPFVYAFYTSIIAGFWVIIYPLAYLPLPFGLHELIPSFASVSWPTLSVGLLSFFSGATFFAGLVWLFGALRKADASDVVPVVGALSAVASFILGYFVLGTALSQNFLLGLTLLSIGTLLVSRLRFPLRVALIAVASGCMFGLHYVLIKLLFNETGFDNGFFWSRLGFVAAALATLLVPWSVRVIRARTKGVKAGGGLLIFVNKILAGISGLMVLKATDWGDVAVVQALGGLQFVFILVLGMLIGHKTPSSCGEEGCRRKEVIHKAIFVSIITLGFLVLFI